MRGSKAKVIRYLAKNVAQRADAPDQQFIPDEKTRRIRHMSPTISPKETVTMKLNTCERKYYQDLKKSLSHG